MLAKGKKPKHLERLLFLGFWLIVLVGGYLAWFSNGADLGAVLTAFRDVLTASAYLGPLLFIAVYALRPITLIPPSLLTISAGLAFGLWFGLLYTFIAETLSSIVGYGIGYFFAHDAADKLRHQRQHWLLKHIDRHTTLVVLTSRLLYVPFDIINFIAGALRISLRKFVLGTVIGMVPGVVAFTSLGASLHGVATISAEDIRTGVDGKLLTFSLVLLGISFSIAVGTRLIRWARHRSS